MGKHYSNRELYNRHEVNESMWYTVTGSMYNREFFRIFSDDIHGAFIYQLFMVDVTVLALASFVNRRLGNVRSMFGSFLFDSDSQVLNLIFFVLTYQAVPLSQPDVAGWCL